MPAESTLLVEGGVAKFRLPDVEWELALERAPSRFPLSLQAALGMGTYATPVEPITKGPPGPTVEYGMQGDDFHEYFLSGSSGHPSGVLVVKRRGAGWTSCMAKSLLPYVLSSRAVKTNAMPPEGTSALPKSLEAVVPVRMRYWQYPAAQAVQIRNALVKTGQFHDRLLKLVDGAIRLCVERLFLYEPTDDELQKGMQHENVVFSLYKATGAQTLIQPLLDEDWLSVMRKHSHDPQTLMLLSSPFDDPAPIIDAILTEKPSAHWLVEHEDTRAARGQLEKLGRLFKIRALDEAPRIFVASFELPGVAWVDSPLPVQGLSCACGEAVTHVTKAFDFVCCACADADAEDAGAALAADDFISKASTRVQSLVFSKDKFTLDEAKAWAKAHGFISSGVDETENSYRIRQFDPDEAASGSFRTIPFKPGIQAVIGKPVEKGANIAKVLKADAEERYVLGIILEPEAVDAQNDIYSAEEIRSAAHTFMEKFRTMGLMHKQGVNDKVKILESYVTPSDIEVQGVPLKAGTWLMGVRVLDDALWDAVKTGGLTGFSIGGSAIRKPETVAAPPATVEAD